MFAKVILETILLKHSIVNLKVTWKTLHIQISHPFYQLFYCVIPIYSSVKRICLSTYRGF